MEIEIIENRGAPCMLVNTFRFNGDTYKISFLRLKVWPNFFNIIQNTTWKNRSITVIWMVNFYHNFDHKSKNWSFCKNIGQSCLVNNSGSKEESVTIPIFHLWCSITNIIRWNEFSPGSKYTLLSQITQHRVK